MVRSSLIGSVVLALCLSFTLSADAAKRSDRKSKPAASQVKKSAPPPTKTQTTPPTQADQLRRLNQLVHQPINNESVDGAQ